MTMGRGQAAVELSQRELVTALHGMLFGGFFLMALAGAFVLLLELSDPNVCASQALPATAPRWRTVFLITLAALGWAAVLSGTYIIYPWYRAAAPPGTANLAGFPQRLLMASPATVGWHSLGMEWKEHVAWLAPISITMAAAVFRRYGRGLKQHPQLRNAVLGFTLLSLVAAAVAGFFGAMINKNAPVEGGTVIHLTNGD
jgi:hypothetical protein